MVIGGYIFAAFLVGLGIWIVAGSAKSFWSSVVDYRRFQYNKGYHIFTRIGMSILMVLGLGVVAFGIYMPFLADQSRKATAEFDRLCADAGGIVIDLDDALPECWKDKLDVSWPS